jgi:hypothetical protein
MYLIEPNDFHRVSGSPVIFLAGPIHGAPRWQEAAFRMIAERAPDVLVASPRRMRSPELYRYRLTPGVERFHRQRAWERHYMEMAATRGAILFWLPGALHTTEEMVYGATTRYELGLWTARAHADSSLGLEIGSDGEFPTIHTIAYDLEMELPERKLHATLGQTIDAAVESARRNFALWREAGAPESTVESELKRASHDELLSLGLGNLLPGNPMNDPDSILMAPAALAGVDASDRQSAIARLEEAAASSWEVIPGGPVDWRLRSWESQGLPAGEPVPGPRYVGIGRSTYYIPFVKRLASILGTPVFQSDYMVWRDQFNPPKSLAWYLETAERIDVNLEGISPESLVKAINTTGAVASPGMLPESYMTSWEINQVHHLEFAGQVFWHTGGSMTHEEASRILGERWPAESIVED